MSKALLVALMTWIASITGLPLADPPHVSTADALTVHRTLYGPESQPSDALEGRGIYNKETQQILLVDGDPTDPVWLSSLVHELVHHMQANSERTYACNGAAEAEAYEVQEEFLRLDQLDLELDFGLGPFLRVILTDCSMSGGAR